MNCEDDGLEYLMEYFESNENLDKNITYIILIAQNTRDSTPKTSSKASVKAWKMSSKS